MARPASIPALRRRRIDRIDDRLLRLLNQRAELALAIATQKQHRNTSIFAPAREKRIFERADAQQRRPARRRASLPRSSARSSPPACHSKSSCASPSSDRSAPSRIRRCASSSARAPKLCRSIPSPRSSTRSSTSAPTTASCRWRTPPKAWCRHARPLRQLATHYQCRNRSCASSNACCRAAAAGAIECSASCRTRSRSDNAGNGWRSICPACRRSRWRVMRTRRELAQREARVAAIAGRSPPSASG